MGAVRRVLLDESLLCGEDDGEDDTYHLLPGAAMLLRRLQYSKLRVVGDLILLYSLTSLTSYFWISGFLGLLSDYLLIYSVLWLNWTLQLKINWLTRKMHRMQSAAQFKFILVNMDAILSYPLTCMWILLWFFSLWSECETKIWKWDTEEQTSYISPQDFACTFQLKTLSIKFVENFQKYDAVCIFSVNCTAVQICVNLRGYPVRYIFYLSHSN